MTTQFKLAQRSANAQKVTFHVIDAKDGSIRGSINVHPEEAEALLRCWSGAKESAKPADPVLAMARKISNRFVKDGRSVALRG